MAVDPSALYGAQVDTSDADYPLGKAKNDIIPGDGNGTPVDKAWISDLWGFQQALLEEAGITASGNPDKVGASQYVDAIKSLMPSARYIIDTGSADPCTLTVDNADPGFSLTGSDTQIAVPSAGKYLVTWGGELTSSTAGSIQRMQLLMRVNLTTQESASGVRYSTDAADIATMSRSSVIEIVNPATQTVSLRPGGSGTVAVNAAFSNNKISIARIG